VFTFGQILLMQVLNRYLPLTYGVEVVPSLGHNLG
jgi:hypothetical protein